MVVLILYVGGDIVVVDCECVVVCGDIVVVCEVCGIFCFL